MMAKGLIVSLCGAFVMACSGCGGGGGAGAEGGAQAAIGAVTQVAPVEAQKMAADSLPEPVSIAPIGNELYALADYKTIRIWNRTTNTFSVPGIAKPPSFDAQIPGNLADHWNPTGVYFYNGKLYVANYNFHDVLIFTVSNDGSLLTLAGVISGMVSPENVMVTDKGIAVADYDASGVFFFSPSGALQWKDTTLSLAHGVAMDANYVYVTDLSGANKLRRYTYGGQPVASNADFSDLLYPTTLSISYDGKGAEQITIIDANRGTLSTYDPDLNKVAQIGNMGPDLFNRPYGFVEATGGIVVADTKNHRLVTIASDGTSLGVSPFVNVVQLGARANWGNGYAYCSDSKLTPPAFSERFDQYIGFDIICTQVNGTMYSSILLPHGRSTPGSLGNRPDPDFNFAWQGNLTVDGQSYWLIGSPSTNAVMVTDSNGHYVFAWHDPKVNVWSVAGAESFLADVVRSTYSQLSVYNQMTAQCSPLYAFLNAGAATKDATLDQQLDAVVEYPNSKALVDQWLAGGSVPASGAQALIAAGQTAYDDLTLITLLSQTTAAKERKVYGTCQGA